MIPQNTIDKIFETANIEEVVRDFVKLEKKGANFSGLCPFHNEKTPSFVVSPARGIYKCFGCGKAGNAVNFVMEHEHYSYPEALKYLAAKYSITIEERKATPEQKKTIDLKKQLLEFNKKATAFFSTKHTKIT